MQQPIVALLENIRSAYNVGSFFRTADGAGLTKLYLAGITPTPPHPGILKTALGAEQSVPWEHTFSAATVAKQLRREHFQIVVVENTPQALQYTAVTYKTPLCLVFGHEVAGVSDELLALAHLIVKIPMHGIKESLNVSTAFGIMAYEVNHQLQR